MAGPPTFRIAFVRKRLARLFGRLAFAAAVLPLAIYAALSLVGGGAIAAIGDVLDGAALAAIPLAAAAFLLGRDLFGSVGTLRAEGEDLVIERGAAQRRLPLSSVREGIIVPDRKGASVELNLASGDQILAGAAGTRDAEDLLRALRVDVEHQRCRVTLADRAALLLVSALGPLGLTFFLGFYTAPLLGDLLWKPLFSSIPHNMLWILAAASYALLSSAMRALLISPDVTVGTDGIGFRRGLRDRFVPFSDLAEVRMSAFGARLHKRDGSTILLRSITGLSPARFQALTLRIREAASARSAAPPQTLEQLDRAGRTIAEWRASLAALARRGTDYRGAGLSAEDLEALLISPDAGAERRIAAAVALSESRHPEAPARIRVAAGQCANERLRIALTQVSEGEADDAAIAEAIGEEEQMRARATSR